MQNPAPAKDREYGVLAPPPLRGGPTHTLSLLVSFSLLLLLPTHYWQAGLPNGSGSEQVLVVPSCVITAVAVAVPL